jgi:hypothetical protein
MSHFRKDMKITRWLTLGGVQAVKSGATYRYVYLDKNGKKVGVVKIDKCSPL